MNIKEQIIDLAKLVVEDAADYQDEVTNNNILQIIISESNQALNFVTLLEDEFNIEFDDDDIDLDFFSDFQKISDIVQKQIKKRN